MTSRFYKEAIIVLKHTRELCESEENKDEKILLSINLSIAYSYFHAYNEKEAMSYLKLIDEMVDKVQLSDDELFDIYNLHIMTKSILVK